MVNTLQEHAKKRVVSCPHCYFFGAYALSCVACMVTCPPIPLSLHACVLACSDAQ